MKITIRTITKDDLPLIWELAYNGDKTWWLYDSPYFNDKKYSKKEFLSEYVIKDSRCVICLDEKIIGWITHYFEDGDLQKWLEIGIDIFDSKLWNKGIGYKAMQIYIPNLFEKYKDIRRVGFSTWSGNMAMMKLGEKLGFKKEAEIRQVRYYNNEYYDSIRYGILKDEWYK